MNISKSNYTSAKQCFKRLWLQKHQPELAEIDDAVKARFNTGHKVGELACSLFPGGTLVEFDLNISNMAETTKKLLNHGVKVIYEAAFVLDSLIAICDILVVKENSFEIYEVKSSTSVKDTYLHDISFQSCVVQKCGYNVSKASLIYINNQYKKLGELNLNQLFNLVDVTDITLQLRKEIEDNIPKIHQMLEGQLPCMDIGEHCKNPYQCEFSTHCWSHIPEYSVFDLYRVGQKAFKYYSQGVITIDDLHKSQVTLKGIQALQLDAKINNRTIIDTPKIREFLSTLKYPLYFLDFESYQEAIPSFDGCKPYEQIPFQYSLHYIEEKNGELKHSEFLGEEGTNPKRTLAEQLCSDISKKGTVLAYNMVFEGTLIKKLAEEFPELSEHLLTIANNLVDLIIPFRNGYYYNGSMKGSFSIKSVLPALFPKDAELAYESLEIKNGTEAMTTFPSLVNCTDEERQMKRKALLQYCKLDTLAMVKILEKLSTL